MARLDAELEKFLANAIDARALDKARQVCINEDIYTVAALADLRDFNQLKDIFTKGTTLNIRKALSGQLQ